MCDVREEEEGRDEFLMFDNELGRGGEREREKERERKTQSSFGLSVKNLSK